MPRNGEFVAREEGTHYGRVLRNLGHMNLLVYCNDGKQRICHIRGAMRRRMWVNIGDIVLVSYREFEVGANTRVGEEKGDVLHKYNTTDHARLRADRTFNPVLLMRLETQADLNNLTLEVGGGGGGAGAAAGYAFQDEGEEEDEKEEMDEETGKPRKGVKSRAEEARRAAGLERKMGGGGGGDDDDLDIDAI